MKKFLKISPKKLANLGFILFDVATMVFAALGIALSRLEPYFSLGLLTLIFAAICLWLSFR